MSNQFISYPKIEQFRNVISGVKSRAYYVGQDETGEAQYDHSLLMPTISFRGTIKLHGTNAGVCFNSNAGMWAQSRSNIITPEKDNAGFAFFVESHKDELTEFFNTVHSRDNINLETHSIAIFGEWCGKGIQKGVSISGLDKMFVIFGVKIAPIDKDLEAAVWVDHRGLSNPESRIYNIEDFPSYEIDIDFARPDIAQAQIIKWVEEVEQECPVGKALGITEGCTTGEGIVFKATYKDCQLMFKAKGEKHSASRVKTIASVDVEKQNSIHEFVEYTCTENRLNQAIEQVFTIKGDSPTVKGTGDFLRWVVNDITKEEIDTLAKSGLEPKEVNKYISTKARTWFMQYLNSQAGL